MQSPKIKKCISGDSYYDSDNIFYLNLIKYLDCEIETLGKEIFNYAYGKNKSYMKILMSVPGIGENDAATLIAGIGNFKVFFQEISLLHSLE